MDVMATLPRRLLLRAVGGVPWDFRFAPARALGQDRLGRLRYCSRGGVSRAPLQEGHRLRHGLLPTLPFASSLSRSCPGRSSCSPTPPSSGGCRSTSSRHTLAAVVARVRALHHLAIAFRPVRRSLPAGLHLEGHHDRRPARTQGLEDDQSVLWGAPGLWIVGDGITGFGGFLGSSSSGPATTVPCVHPRGPDLERDRRLRRSRCAPTFR